MKHITPHQWMSPTFEATRYGERLSEEDADNCPDCGMPLVGATLPWEPNYCLKCDEEE